VDLGQQLFEIAGIGIFVNGHKARLPIPGHRRNGNTGIGASLPPLTRSGKWHAETGRAHG
ncbi:MAG: hypothetical protein KIS91_02950, partial [Anaerolineae bacterium]|nr:hypothetical protein [Anaerolineae bacterium]